MRRVVSARRRTIIATDFRIDVDSRGRAWAAPPFGYGYWADRLSFALPILLVARGEPLTSEGSSNSDRQVVGGPGVDVVLLPPLRPGIRLAVEVPRALRTIWRLDRDDPLLLVVPGVVGFLALIVQLCRRRPFAVQVVGDPIDVAFRAGVGGRLAPIVGAILGSSTWLACRRAAVLSYVTGAYLQRRYPPRPGSPVYVFSDVQLQGRGHRTRNRPTGGELHIVTVGSLEQPYKRVDLLLRALAVLRHEGYALKLQVVGSGSQLRVLKDLARVLDVDRHVNFLGTLDIPALDQLFADSDVFVLCSDTEGMPRALLEAIAAGLPCVASAVGGIPEVLGPQALFESGSLDSLLAVLRRTLASSNEWGQGSQPLPEGFERFSPETLAVVKHNFFRSVSRMRAS